MRHKQSPKQYQCPNGFSIVQAIINMRAWNPEGVKTGSVLIKPETLFSYRLLRKVLFSEGEQANKAFLSKRINNLTQDILASGLVHKGYVSLEINAQALDFSSHHPCFTKQEVKIKVVYYQAPELDVFTPETFQLYIIPGETKRKLQMW